MQGETDPMLTNAGQAKNRAGLRLCAWDDFVILSLRQHVDNLSVLQDLSDEAVVNLLAAARRAVNSTTAEKVPKYLVTFATEPCSGQLAHTHGLATAPGAIAAKFSATPSFLHNDTGDVGMQDRHFPFDRSPLRDSVFMPCPSALKQKQLPSSNETFQLPLHSASQGCVMETWEHETPSYDTTHVSEVGRATPTALCITDPGVPSGVESTMTPRRDGGATHLQDNLRVPNSLHVCPFCKISQSYLSTFRTHMLEKHEIQYTLKCRHCPQFYFLESRFRDHHKKAHKDCLDDWHLGDMRMCADRRDRPQKTCFGCGFCGLGFENLGDYIRHLYQEHSNTDGGSIIYSFDNVIHGLLRRPQVAGAWRSAHDAQRIYTWSKPDARLIAELELGRSDKSTFDRDPQGVAQYLVRRVLDAADGTLSDKRAETFFPLGLEQPRSSHPRFQPPYRSKRSERFKSFFKGGPFTNEHDNEMMSRVPMPSSTFGRAIVEQPSYAGTQNVDQYTASCQHILQIKPPPSTRGFREFI